MPLYQDVILNCFIQQVAAVQFTADQSLVEIMEDLVEDRAQVEVDLDWVSNARNIKRLV